MVTRPKVWINETATTTATQTDILIDLTLDEPWIEHVHVVKHPRSPADNRHTVDMTNTIWDKIFKILGSGGWKNRIPYKDWKGNFDPQFKQIDELISEVVSKAQNIVKNGHEDQWCPEEQDNNTLPDWCTERNFFK
jgi:hypothetical protein